MSAACHRLRFRCCLIDAVGGAAVLEPLRGEGSVIAQEFLPEADFMTPVIEAP